MPAPVQMDRKVAAGGFAGAFATIGLWVLREYVGVDPPPEVASAIATVIIVAIGWVVPSKKALTSP